MRRVIVNSTPLIVLCNVKKIDILRKLYSEVVIPEAVYQEVTEKKDSACKILEYSSDWIHVEKIQSQSDKKMYQAKQEGYISEVAPILKDLQKVGFYISPSLAETVLKKAGEDDLSV